MILNLQIKIVKSKVTVLQKIVNMNIEFFFLDIIDP